MIDNPCDHAEEIRELRRMIRELATHSGLGNSSITSGALFVATPGEGVRVKDGSSVAAGDMKLGSDGGVGSLKAGTSEVTKDGVGSGGTKIRNDGKIWHNTNQLKVASNTEFEGNLKSAGTVEAQVVKASVQVEAGGTKIGSDGGISNDSDVIEFKSNMSSARNFTTTAAVRASQGVFAPYTSGGALVSLGPAVKAASDDASAAQSTANTALSRANSALSDASTADTKAGNAQSSANSAMNRANAAMAKANEIIDALADLEAFVRSQHPSKPLYPPPAKG